ncbi:MAG: hypothetical protein FD135_3768 [Comamonadaceae bacterium]|nr:MAG: hypothetical protein FD135_3768 [Comamonadaceae bacterium]
MATTPSSELNTQAPSVETATATPAKVSGQSPRQEQVPQSSRQTRSSPNHTRCHQQTRRSPTCNDQSSHCKTCCYKTCCC